MQVERTLVKSPPELWAEVSDVEALTRHLSQFGEITITRVEPESKVAWEGERARGTVELTASGWGTKVKLTAEEEPQEPDEEPVQITAEQAVVELAAATLEPTLRNRWGWLAFWRRSAEIPGPAPTPPAPEPTPPSPAPSPGPPGPPSPTPPQIKVDEVLAEALDSLGAAHHRPFSR